MLIFGRKSAVLWHQNQIGYFHDEFSKLRQGLFGHIIFSVFLQAPDKMKQNVYLVLALDHYQASSEVNRIESQH